MLTSASQAEHGVQYYYAEGTRQYHGQPDERQPPEAVYESPVWLLFQQLLHGKACVQVEALMQAVS